jgi:hypothetical protein
VVFFDTNESEQGDAHKKWRIEQILRDVEHELVAIGADECLEVLRTQLIDRFCGSVSAAPGS